MCMKPLIAKIKAWWKRFVKNHIVDRAPDDWDI